MQKLRDQISEFQEENIQARDKNRKDELEIN